MAVLRVGGPGVVVVARARGVLDFSEQDTLREALGLAVHRCLRLLVVDCAEVAFMDSTAIGVLVAVAKQLTAKGCSIRLLNVSPSIDRVLAILQLQEYLSVSVAGESVEQYVSAALAWGGDDDLSVEFGTR